MNVGEGAAGRADPLEQFIEGWRADILRIDAAQAELIDRRPGRADLPRPHRSGHAVIGVAIGAVQIECLEEGRVAQDRHREFDIAFLDVLLTERLADIGRVPQQIELVRRCPQALCRAVEARGDDRLAFDQAWLIKRNRRARIDVAQLLQFLPAIIDADREVDRPGGQIE